MIDVPARHLATQPDGSAAARARVTCRVARGAAQLAMHYRIRHAVFVEEQGIFTGSDVDEHDARDGVVHVLAYLDEHPIGTVRLYPLDSGQGLWQGDRLAVLAHHREHGAGAPLVRFAVAHARAHGGQRMIAHIQPPNVRFFEHLGWSAYRETENYMGRMHQPMHIRLGDG